MPFYPIASEGGSSLPSAGSTASGVYPIGGGGSGVVRSTARTASKTRDDLLKVASASNSQLRTSTGDVATFGELFARLFGDIPRGNDMSDNPSSQPSGPIGIVPSERMSTLSRNAKIYLAIGLLVLAGIIYYYTTHKTKG